MLPYAIWREAFINDADLPLARATYTKLNPHPYRKPRLPGERGSVAASRGQARSRALGSRDPRS